MNVSFQEARRHSPASYMLIVYKSSSAEDFLDVEVDDLSFYFLDVEMNYLSFFPWHSKKAIFKSISGHLKHHLLVFSNVLFKSVAAV